MSESEPLGFSIAPGVFSAILNDKEQSIKRGQGNYVFTLGDMDLAQHAVANMAAHDLGLDYAAPTGYLCFKSTEERLKAIEEIYRLHPRELGWKWRQRNPSPKSDMNINERIDWMLTQPIDEKYLKGTSKDPDNSID